MKNLARLLAFFALTSIAAAQAPPPVPVVADADRVQTYSLTSSTASVNINFPVYGDCTDLQVELNNNRLVLNTDWTCASASGKALNTLPLPITDMFVTFSPPLTSGGLVITGDWHPRRLSQPTAPGITRYEFNATMSGIISSLREIRASAAVEGGGGAPIAKPFAGSFWNELPSTVANIQRLPDREFGGAMDRNDGFYYAPACPGCYGGGFTDLDWFDNLNHVNVGGQPVNGGNDGNFAQMAVLADPNSVPAINPVPLIAILGAAETIHSPTGATPRALEGITFNNASIAGSYPQSWALYLEAHQVTANAGATYAIELEGRNIAYPWGAVGSGWDSYQHNYNNGVGTYGIEAGCGGGRPNIGGYMYPCAVALDISANPLPFESGIRFLDGSIDQKGIGNTFPAIQFPANYSIMWYKSAGVTSATMRGDTFGNLVLSASAGADIDATSPITTPTIFAGGSMSGLCTAYLICGVGSTGNFVDTNGTGATFDFSKTSDNAQAGGDDITHMCGNVADNTTVLHPTWCEYWQGDVMATSARGAGVAHWLLEASFWNLGPAAVATLTPNPYIDNVANSIELMRLDNGIGSSQTASNAIDNFIHFINNNGVAEDGIVFARNSLDVSAGRIAPALSLGPNHAIDWFWSASDIGWQLYSTATANHNSLVLTSTQAQLSAPLYSGGEIVSKGGSLPTLANGTGGMVGAAVNGLVLTGQGSTADITLLNKSGGGVGLVPTGTTDFQFLGGIIGAAATGGAATKPVCSDAAGRWFAQAAACIAPVLPSIANNRILANLSGATAAPAATPFDTTLANNAGALGLNLANQNSWTVAQNFTSAVFAGGGPPTLSNGVAAVYSDATYGLVLVGKGSGNDLLIANSSLGGVAVVPTGTQIFSFLGGVRAASLPTSGTGGVFVCVDTSGNFYKKATCP